IHWASRVLSPLAVARASCPPPASTGLFAPVARFCLPLTQPLARLHTWLSPSYSCRSSANSPALCSAPPRIMLLMFSAPLLHSERIKKYLDDLLVWLANPVVTPTNKESTKKSGVTRLGASLCLVYELAGNVDTSYGTCLPNLR